MKPLPTLLFFLFLASILPAQELNQLHIVGKGEFLPGELIARSDENMDANGQLAAGLLIVSDIGGFTYSPWNGLVKDVVHRGPGEDLLFLSPTERRVDVYKSGYEKLPIILYDYGVNLQSGRVWQLKITGDKILDKIPITIKKNPEDATVFIDGKNKGTGATFQVSKGKHKIRIEKKGRKTITEDIDVSPQNILFEYNLQFLELKTVTVRSYPTGAKIIIDGVEESTTDDQIFKFPGNYKLKLSKSGYLDIEKQITITETGENTFTYTLLKNTVTLKLNVSPSNAEVMINKKAYTNISAIELAPGGYQLEISKNGYKGITDYIELAIGNPLTKTYALEQMTGTLQFKINPIHAEVILIQNKKIINKWQGAKILQNLAVGNYMVECNLMGYKSKSEKIIIIEKEVTDTYLVLEAKNKNPVANINNFDSIELVFVKGNTFQMGWNQMEADESPAHPITLGDYYIGKFEITQKQWKEIMGTNPSHFKGDDLPVEQITWYQAIEFCNKLSEKEGLEKVYTITPKKVNLDLQLNGYRLPTEAEWEFAAQSGKNESKNLYSGNGNLYDIAWYGKNSNNKTHSVGKKKPNGLQIYDMTGNVSELCFDYYDATWYYKTPSINPVQEYVGDFRVERGGCWYESEETIYLKNRNKNYPDKGLFNVGFRVAKTYIKNQD